MWALVLGFLSQAAGYEVGFLRGSSGKGTACEAVVGMAWTAAGVIFVLAARRACEPRVKRRLVEIAMFPVDHYARFGRLERPSAIQLSHYGREYGAAMLPEEKATLAVSDENTNGHVIYARRVFGVDAGLQGGVRCFRATTPDSRMSPA